MAWPAPWRDRYCRRPTYSRPPTGRCGSPLLTRGVLRFDGTEWRLFTTADGLAAAEAYINFVETRDGALWVTCLGEGLSRFDGERWTIHKPMDVVWFVGVWLSQDGDLWTGVPSGRLARFDGRDWQSYSADQVQQILGPSSRGRRLDGMVTSDGVFWLSTDEVAARLDPAGPTRYRHPDGLFGGFEDPAGGVWFHTDHLAVHHRDGEWIGHTAADGFLDGEVYGAWQAPTAMSGSSAPTRERRPWPAAAAKGGGSTRRPTVSSTASTSMPSPIRASLRLSTARKA